MRAKKDEKSRENRATSSPKERKSRGSARERNENTAENPLHERTRSADNNDKRKVRRDFFNEKRENSPRSSQRRSTRQGEERKDSSSKYNSDRRGSDRDHKSSDRRSSDRPERRDSDRQYDDRERKSFRRDDEQRSSSRYNSDRRDNRSSDRRSSDRPERRDSDRRYDDRERKPFRRDDEQRSSSRYNSDRRGGGDRDRRPSDRFERDGQREDRRPFRRQSDRDNDRRNYGDKPNRGRSAVLDSDIMREIVQKRRATGRSSNKQKVLSLAWSEERGPIRLNKYISNSGICSRREADQLIIAGAVTVNGEIVTELGIKVMPTDEVRYEDKVLQREKPVYLLLNKPKDYITTTEDDRDRDNVMMLIEGACPERIYPVGRLDRNSTGLLLFTNDGEMAKKLTHPRYEMKKIYQVDLDRNMSLADFETLANGVELSDGFIKPDELAFVDGQENVLGITLHSGKNRIVRRMFDHLGYEVEKLDRVYYAGLTKKDLPRGEWRFLRQEEINILKMSL